MSVFESVQSDRGFESVYLECRESNTVTNDIDPNKCQRRNEPYRSRPYENSKNCNRKEAGDKPRVKKFVNPNKPPLAAEKKKNSMCTS